MFLLIYILWILWQILHFEVCRCAVDAIPVCDPSCLNGATCLAQNSCMCPAGYDGDRCQDACLDYLGMENGDIPDGNIQASTYFLTYTPHKARLNGELGWVAESTHRNPWIQADIGYQTYVSGVATQGYYYGTHWVTSFKVSTFSMTTFNPETYIRDNGASAKVFQGNTDGTSIVTSTFPEPVFARIVRITCLERTDTNYWVMRFEILGCKRDNELPTIAHNFTNVKISTKPGLPNTSVWWNDILAVTDNFGEVTLTSNFQPGDTFHIGNTDVVYTAVDENGNVANVTFTVTVIDLEPPVIVHTFSNIAINNEPGLPTANVTWSENIIATDNSGSSKLTSNFHPGDMFPIRITNVTYTATDESGNVDNVVFTVTVIDIEAPIIRHNFTNITVNTDYGLPTAIVTWNENIVSVTDNSGLVTLTSSYGPGDTFPEGNTNVEYTATDESGNIAVMIFVVTVIDMELPTIAHNFTNVTVTTDPGLPTAIVWWNDSLTVTDNFEEVTLTSNFHHGDTFPIGNTDVVYTAVDVNGNVANVTFTVTVIDMEAPIIAHNFSNITINNDPRLPTAIVLWSENITVTDNSGSVTMTSSSKPGDAFPIGSTDVTYTATDENGNIAVLIFTVTVLDIEAPIIAHHFTNITINNEPGLPTANVTWSNNITVTDNSGSVKLTSSSQPGDTFPIGNTEVTYTATDESGNIAVLIFTVTVLDIDAPIIGHNFTNITINTNPRLPTAIVMWNENITVTDNSGLVTLTSSHEPGDTFPIGNTNVTYTATDETGNVAVMKFVVTVIDIEAPLITHHFKNLTVNTDPGLPSAVVTWDEPDRVTDNSGSVRVTSNHQSGDTFRIGRTDIIYTANDKSGNIQKASFAVTVKDNEDPKLQCPVVPEYFAVTDQLSIKLTWPSPIYYDNSEDEAATNSSLTSPWQFAIGRHEVFYEAWDPSGNMASCSIPITVTASCPNDVVVVKSKNTSWSMTPAANQSSVDSNERCDVNTEKRGHGIATRICWQDVHRGAIWADASYVGCGDKDEADIQELAQTPVIESNVVNVAEALVNVTQNVDKLTSDDIDDLATTFQSIVNVESATPEVTTAVVGIVDNLVDVKSNPKQTSKPSAIVDILKAFETQILKSTEQGSNISVVQPNIVLKTTTIQPNKEGKKTSLSFAVRCAKDDDNSFKEGDLLQIGDDNVTQKEEKTRTSISFPAALFDVDGNETIGVSIVVHNSDALFPTNLTNQTVSGDIISAIVTGIDKISNLSEPIALQFTDVTYEKSHIILDVMSKVGCGLSMFCLFITLVIFSSFRRLRSGNSATSRKILMQFCTALFLLYFVFLVGIDQTSNRGGCIFVAFLLHFLTLASLSWMGVEAYHLYLNVVKVFDAMPEKFLLKSSVIAWGCPLLVSIISLGAGMQDYSHLKYCFIENGHTLNYGLVLPIAVIMLINTITFARVMHRLMRANLGGNVSQKSKAQQISQRLQNAFAISVLMGLTWMFGFFAIEGAKFAFSLLFCLCNSFQGVVVFVLFCLRQEDVKKTLLHFFRSKFRLSDRFTQSMTASTGVMSSTSQSQTPYGDMDFSLAKIPAATIACTTTDGIDKERITPEVTNTAADVEEQHETGMVASN